MTKIEGTIQDLKEICRLVSLKGKDINGKEHIPIPEFLISAGSSPNLLEISAMDRGSHLVVGLKYKMSVPSAGSMCIGNVIKFGKYLDRFNNSDTVTIESTENRISIKKPGKVARFPMASEDSIEGREAVEVLKRFVKKDGVYASAKTNLNVSLSLVADDVKRVVDDGEAVDQRIYPWTLSENGLMVKVGEEQTGIIETEIPIESLNCGTGSVDVKTSYAYGIDNLFGNLSGRVKIYLANGIGACPLILEQETEKYKFKALLAPVVLPE